LPGLKVAPSGHLAVDFFFCLSGFVVSLAYRRKIQLGELGYVEFFVRRLVRFYPLHLVGLALGFLYFAAELLVGLHPGLDWKGLILSGSLAAFFLTA
jgi:peptidoglycan/LPS O-acetylase OafA/YrhL